MRPILTVGKKKVSNKLNLWDANKLHSESRGTGIKLRKEYAKIKLATSLALEIAQDLIILKNTEN